MKWVHFCLVKFVDLAFNAFRKEEENHYRGCTMGIRTVEEYKASLRDGRRVYIRGEKVEDVTRHPILGVSVDTVAQGFALTASEDPEVRNLFRA